jgi:DNA-binding response OmpR family regulator
MKNRIFVVDDEPDVKLALKIALEENGFEVDAFDDPVIALNNFRKNLVQDRICHYTLAEFV